MILEAEISRQLGILSQVAVGRLTRCLKAYNLPISTVDPRIASLPAAKLLTVDRLLDIMRIDKKNSGPAKKIVLLKRIGKTFEERATVVKDAVIAKTLAEAVRVVPGLPSKNPVKMATPGSKSISNRVLVLAALGKGTCRLKNLLHSDDTQVMMTALNELKVIAPVTTSMKAHILIYSFNRELNSLGKMEGRRWSLKGGRDPYLFLPRGRNCISATQERLHVS